MPVALGKDAFHVRQAVDVVQRRSEEDRPLSSSPCSTSGSRPRPSSLAWPGRTADPGRTRFLGSAVEQPDLRAERSRRNPGAARPGPAMVGLLDERDLDGLQAPADAASRHGPVAARLGGAERQGGCRGRGHRLQELHFSRDDINAKTARTAASRSFANGLVSSPFQRLELRPKVLEPAAGPRSSYPRPGRPAGADRACARCGAQSVVRPAWP